MSNNDWLKHYGVKGMRWRQKRGQRTSHDFRKELYEMKALSKRNNHYTNRFNKTGVNSTKRVREKDHNSVVNRVKRFSANVAKTSKATVNRGYNALQSILKKYR